MSVAAENSTSVLVKWEPIPKESIYGILSNYVIYYKHSGEKEQNKNVSRNKEQAVINGLKASTEYSFRVSAATVKGIGPRSDPKLATTKGAFFWDYSGIGILGMDGISVLLGAIPFSK